MDSEIAFVPINSASFVLYTDVYLHMSKAGSKLDGELLENPFK